MKNVPISTIHGDELYTTPFPSFVLNLEGQVLLWNKLCEQYFGFSEQDMLQAEALHTFFSPIQEHVQTAIYSNAQPQQFNALQVLLKNEQLINVSFLTRPCRFQNQLATVVLCIPADELKRIDEANRQTNGIQEGINNSFMTVTLDNEGFILACNSSFLKVSRWTPKRVLGKTFWQLFPSNDENYKIAQTIWKTISQGQVWQGDVQKVTRDGELYWTFLTAIPLHAVDERNNEYILMEKDITKEKTVQLRLEKIAYIDTETGLMNVHRLEQIVSKMVEEGRHFSFVYLSIDKFYTLKELQQQNDKGNLIIEFTKRLKMYFQDSTMARINENDFVVITPLPEWFTQGFVTYLQQNPVYIGNVAAPITLSGGITRFPEDQSTFAQIMKASIATIATVREAGGASILSLSKSTHKALSRKSLVEKRLLLALDQKNLKVLYQPQFDVETQRIVAAEALVRWEDSEIGVVSPDELIPIAEETGLIHNIGTFMIEQACRAAVRWQKAGMPLKVCINSSVREFRDKNMAKSILETLEQTGCPAHLIQIEITEKFALEAEAEYSITKQMRQLEQAGITFALDDFGTGYASFRYMQLLPLQTLKIDQTFMSSLIQSEKQQRLVNGIVQLGKSMNLKVVAEGVETEEQQVLLTQYGCDILQGYHISKPISEMEIKELYRSMSNS